MAAEFSATCLSAGGSAKILREHLPAEDWLTAGKSQLEELSLQRLKKAILEIPGGGGKYKQTQSLFFKSEENVSLVLNLEESYSKNRLVSEKCELYSKVDFLENCAALGKFLNRTPDRNQIYKQQDAQFINWQSTINNRPALIRCKRNPTGQTLGYKGIVMSLLVSNGKIRNN